MSFCVLLGVIKCQLVSFGLVCTTNHLLPITYDLPLLIYQLQLTTYNLPTYTYDLLLGTYYLLNNN